MNRKQKKQLKRIIISALLLLTVNLLPLPRLLSLLLYALSYFTVGRDVLRKAAKGIVNRQVFDENFLMAVATVGAIVIALWDGSGDFNEAVAVMLFYQVGELFEGVAVGKSRRSINQLMDIRPDYARLETAEGGESVDPDEVEVGSVIIVHPGERIPIDGVIIEGSASVDSAALTGESLPKELTVGDEVISGCISLNAVLRIRTTKIFGESTVARILELVENSGMRKSRMESFISRFAQIYTPAVCYSALALALLPPVVQLLLGNAPQWHDWIYRALTFLVISCPCALVISIPLSFFAGIGGAGREGVLVKGSNFLEAMSQVKTMVFDKTGTLTRGELSVREVKALNMSEERLIELAAHAEHASSHPVSLCIRKHFADRIEQSRVRDIHELSGMGISAVVDGISVAVGNDRLMAELGINAPAIPDNSGGVHVAAEGEYAGCILIADSVKPGAHEAIKKLRAMGVERIVMLTGDSEAAAKDVWQKLGIDECYSSLLPQDKVEKLEEIISSSPAKAKVAFAGDGINDAPVIMRSDIGIAMGALGSDAAIEAADVVLMDDEPLKIAKAIGISRKCIGIVRQNIVFALGVKFLCLILGALGLAGMWAAIFADVGVMVLAVLNAVRAMDTKRIQ